MALLIAPPRIPPPPVVRAYGSMPSHRFTVRIHAAAAEECGFNSTPRIRRRHARRPRAGRHRLRATRSGPPSLRNDIRHVAREGKRVAATLGQLVLDVAAVSEQVSEAHAVLQRLASNEQQGELRNLLVGLARVVAPETSSDSSTSASSSSSSSSSGYETPQVRTGRRGRTAGRRPRSTDWRRRQRRRQQPAIVS